MIGQERVSEEEELRGLGMKVVITVGSNPMVFL
jgi:hypothetical protein